MYNQSPRNCVVCCCVESSQVATQTSYLFIFPAAKLAPSGIIGKGGFKVESNRLVTNREALAGGEVGVAKKEIVRLLFLR